MCDCLYRNNYDVLLHFAAQDVTYMCPYSGPKRGNLSVTNFKLYFKQTDHVRIMHKMYEFVNVREMIVDKPC